MANAAAVDRPVALDDLALVVDQDEIGRADEVEAEPQRIDPEAIGPLWIASGHVTCDPFVEAEAPEQPEGGGQPLLDVGPLVLDRVELRKRVWGAAGSHQWNLR